MKKVEAKRRIPNFISDNRKPLRMFAEQMPANDLLCSQTRAIVLTQALISSKARNPAGRNTSEKSVTKQLLVHT